MVECPDRRPNILSTGQECELQVEGSLQHLLGPAVRNICAKQFQTVFLCIISGSYITIPIKWHCGNTFTIMYTNENERK